MKYLDRETYDKLIAALLAIETSTFVDKESAIKIALGEIANIWPDDIDDDDVDDVLMTIFDDVNIGKAA